MDSALLRAVLLLIPIGALFVWSIALFLRTTTAFTFIQLVGAGLLVIVVLTHICEALGLFRFMQWGSPHRVGHYLDLGCALLGLILLPAGFLLRYARAKRAR